MLSKTSIYRNVSPKNVPWKSFISNLASIVESNIPIFADDTFLFVASECNDRDIRQIDLNGDLSAIPMWTDQWLVSLKEDKLFQ